MNISKTSLNAMPLFKAMVMKAVYTTFFAAFSGGLFADTPVAFGSQMTLVIVHTMHLHIHTTWEYSAARSVSLRLILYTFFQICLLNFIPKFQQVESTIFSIFIALPRLVFRQIAPITTFYVL